MKRELPEIDIRGTAFIVDVIKEELREKTNTENVIPVKDMLYQGYGNGYFFAYDPALRNFPTDNQISIHGLIEEHLRVAIPELAEIDPVGMAEKYGLEIDQVRGKTDFELRIIPGSPLDRRWNKGILPTLDIAGQIFFVDLRMNKLRPKDDFSTTGIDIIKLDDYYDQDRDIYTIPYNPKTHEFQQIDLSILTDLPKDVIIIEFSSLIALDPAGFVKTHKLDTSELMHEDFTLASKARIVPWEETDMTEHIKRNVAEQLRPLVHIPSRYTQQEYPYRIPTDTTRILPEIQLYTGLFIVDVNQLELRDKNNPSNTIGFHDLIEKADGGYKFWFNVESGTLGKYKNAATNLVEIPDFVKLDPEGMAKKHHLTPQQISKLSDVDLLIDKDALNKIAEHNILPQIEIAGHTFFVDMDNNKLQPKDDIWSPGIIFSEIEAYYSAKENAYFIPYNQKTHSFEPVNLTMSEIPKDLCVVQIPHESILNPVWNNHKMKNESNQFLKSSGVHLNFKAPTIPWSQTSFEKTVQMNQHQRRNDNSPDQSEYASKQRKGRKL